MNVTTKFDDCLCSLNARYVLWSYMKWLVCHKARQIFFNLVTKFHYKLPCLLRNQWYNGTDIWIANTRPLGCFKLVFLSSPAKRLFSRILKKLAAAEVKKAPPGDPTYRIYSRIRGRSLITSRNILTLLPSSSSFLLHNCHKIIDPLPPRPWRHLWTTPKSTRI